MEQPTGPPILGERESALQPPHGSTTWEKNTLLRVSPSRKFDFHYAFRILWIPWLLYITSRPEVHRHRVAVSLVSTSEPRSRVVSRDIGFFWGVRRVCQNATPTLLWPAMQHEIMWWSSPSPYNCRVYQQLASTALYICRGSLLKTLNDDLLSSASNLLSTYHENNHFPSRRLRNSDSQWWWCHVLKLMWECHDILKSWSLIRKFKQARKFVFDSLASFLVNFMIGSMPRSLIDVTLPAQWCFWRKIRGKAGLHFLTRNRYEELHITWATKAYVAAWMNRYKMLIALKWYFFHHPLLIQTLFYSISSKTSTLVSPLTHIKRTLNHSRCKPPQHSSLYFPWPALSQYPMTTVTMMAPVPSPSSPAAMARMASSPRASALKVPSPHSHVSVVHR